MSRFLVTQCICHARSFQEIKDFAEQEGISTTEELQSLDFCSTSCKMCKPYIEMMFDTGNTAFEAGAYLKQRVD